MKPLYSVLAIFASLTIIGMVTISTQQVFAPRTCSGCGEFKKLTNEFEKDVIDAATTGDPNTISGLLDKYNEDVRGLDLVPRS